MELPTEASSKQPITKKPRELRIGIPATFTGDTYKYNDFKQSVQLYLSLNKAIYDTDFKKITFALNYLKGGAAALWRSKWLREHLKMNNFGTYQDFISALDKVFLTQDDEDRMGRLTDLENVKQNGRRAAEFVTEFRVYAYLADLPSSTPGSDNDGYIISLFKSGLDRWLLKKALLGGGAPNTLAEWYTRVVQLDENYRLWNLNPDDDEDTDEWKSRSDLGENLTSEGEGGREAMLTCFECGKVGHFSRNCLSKDINVVKPRNPNYKGKNYDPNYRHSSSRRPKAGDKSPKMPRLS